MIQWVYERTARCLAVNRVIVATDDERIASAVRAFGGEVVMTRTDHSTGTEATSATPPVTTTWRTKSWRRRQHIADFRRELFLA